MSNFLGSPHDPTQQNTETLNALRPKWAWFVVIGIVLIVLGMAALAHVLTATLVNVIFIGSMMLIGGIGLLIQAWRVKNWSGFLFSSLSGLLYAFAGLVAIINPWVGAAMLTLLLGATLIGAGVFRLWVWFKNRNQPGASWLLISALLTFVVGILIANGWPTNSLTILGFLLGFDLLIQGWSLMFTGLALRKAH